MKASDLPRRQAEMRLKNFLISAPECVALLGKRDKEFVVRRKPDGTLVALVTSKNQPIAKKAGIV